MNKRARHRLVETSDEPSRASTGLILASIFTETKSRCSNFLFQFGSRLVKVQSCTSPATRWVQTLTCAKKKKKKKASPLQQPHYVESSSGALLRFPRLCVHHYGNAEVCQECWLLDNRGSFFSLFLYFFFFFSSRRVRRDAPPNHFNRLAVNLKLR